MAIQAQLYPENLGLPLGGGGGSQDWFVDINNYLNNNNNIMNMYNGCGFNDMSFNVQQKQQQQQVWQLQQQQQQQQQQAYYAQLQSLQQQQRSQNNQSVSLENGYVFLPSSKNCNSNNSTTTTTTTSSNNDHMSVNFSQSFASLLEKQSQEIDRCVIVQSERLKVTLQEQRKQQLAAILRKVEAKTSALLKNKDYEITKARNRSVELEEFVRKLELENQTWQRVASENEKLVVDLSNSLEQLKEQQQQGCFLTNCDGVDDSESCCDNNEYNMEENRANATGEEGKTGDIMACRVCNSRESCMLLLPCRHLCSCKACDAFLDACPVCKSVKKASIEALIS